MLKQNRTQRLETIFQLVVEHYLKHGTPVSSKWIAANAKVCASSATVRNELIQLDQQGLLFSPHTSAGRLPTTVGLEKYVGQIIDRQHQPANILQQMSNALGQSLIPEIICTKASKLLSRITDIAGLVILPSSSNDIIKQVELVSLADKRLLCVLINEHDQVQNRVIELGKPVSAQTMQQALLLMNSALAGVTMSEGSERLPYFLKQSSDEVCDLVKLALFGDKVEANQHQVFSAGLSKLLKHEVTNDSQSLINILSIFEDVAPLLPMLTRCPSHQVSVTIGKNIPVAGLEDCALVCKPIELDNQMMGYIAVLGPKRMNYQQVIEAVDITANIVTLALNRQLQSP